MDLPFTRDQFFDLFATYNRTFWPFALALWVYALLAAVLLARAHRGASQFISLLLAVLWSAAALYHAVLFSTINPAAWLFAALSTIEAGLLVWFGLVRRQVHVSSAVSLRHAAAWILIVYALCYPLLTQLEGHAYPRTPTFGVPCPTTILTIGMLLAADPPWPRVIAIVPVLWASVAGFAAVALDVRSDLMLWAAAAALVVDLLATRRVRLAA